MERSKINAVSRRTEKADDEIKRKVRKLKHFEEKIRFGGNPATGNLVWNRFFDLQESGNRQAKYSLQDLSFMSPEDYKRVVAEYMAFVYYEICQAEGLVGLGRHYDPEALGKLGLPPYSTEQDIKRRFRELAKQYHPDAGGDAGMFIELMDQYKKLTGIS